VFVGGPNGTFPVNFKALVFAEIEFKVCIAKLGDIGLYSVGNTLPIAVKNVKIDR